jgi:serine/threonine protein kinase
MALEPGARLGPYQIVSPAGAGGMGEVYRARDTRLDRTVAIKVLPPDLTSDPTARQRFEREARAVAALSHPHICTLHDIGHQDGTDYLVMEYLDGETLAARLTRGKLPVDQALQYGIQIADALAAAHKAGIVHRDLKPGNVMLTSPARSCWISDWQRPVSSWPAWARPNSPPRARSPGPARSSGPCTTWLPSNCKGRRLTPAPTCSPSGACCTKW